MRIKILITIILILTVVACILGNYYKKNIKTVSVSAITKSLSNKKIGWGVKREKNHKQPDLGKENLNLINKYRGIAIGKQGSKNIYLTFDNGYEAGYTSEILNILKENKVPAIFFITGHYLNTSEDLVKRMIAEGHLVGNHTVNHNSMPDIDDEKIKKEVMNFHIATKEKVGYEMKYIRPPKGEFSERTLYLSQSLGYTNVMWSLAYDDWDEKKQGREEYGKKKILDNLHDGAVILLHGTSKDNMNILDYCIKQAREKGYEFKSLDEFE